MCERGGGVVWHVDNCGWFCFLCTIPIAIQVVQGGMWLCMLRCDNIVAPCCCNCTLGWEVMMSLFGLHSCIPRVSVWCFNGMAY